MKLKHALSCMIAALALIPGVAVASEEPANEDPKLVLVLSGGGARGIAHIGVIRVLEELHIAPDLIVGTSMGSIIGGLYAAGWSPDEMEEIVRAIDWEQIFTDRVERKHRSFRRKQDDRPVMIQGRIHFDGFKPVLPSGVIDGQRLEAALRSIEALSVQATDFDNLPIPYRAVAADIFSGEAVVISSGSLATAIRASMSVPGVLPPVEIADRKLVDGGITANLPIGIAQDLGAKRIIAVDISSPLLDEEGERLGSFMSIYNHLNSLLTARNRERDVALLQPDDALIIPDLGDISFVSFDRVQEAVAIGEEAARLQIDELRQFSATDARWSEFDGRERARGLESLEIDRIRLENSSGVDDRLVRKALTIRPPEIFDWKSLGSDILDLYNTRYFGVVDFGINEIEEDMHELVLRTPPPPQGRGTLQFGVGFLDDFDGGSTYHVQTRHQFIPANRRGGEWETTLQLGTVFGARTSFYQPLDWGMKWFVEPSLTYELGTQEIWLLGQALADYKFRSVDARIAAGRTLGKWGEFRLSVFTGDNRGSPRIGLPEFDSESAGRGGGEARFRVDTEDSVVFPRVGANFDLRYSLSSESLGSDTGFEQIWGKASYAWSFGENTIVPSVEYGENRKPLDSFFNVYFLGGLFRLSGLGNKELFGDSIALARLVGYRRMFQFEAAGLKFKIYVGLSLEAGNAYFDGQEISWNSMLKGGSVFVGGDTFIGPIIFAYGRTEGNRDRFYLAIGDTF
ncbi:MAG: patatin-like phospholipase family protein [Acidobacteria bacterium]|nr:patatin-like phospholipase family protein [Acidobacteriota bacterium]